MFLRVSIIGLQLSVLFLFFGYVFVHGVFAGSFPPLGMALPEYWGEEHVWWDGRAAFHGEVVRPACTLAMEDAWQIIDMGETPVQDLQNGFSGPEGKFNLRLGNCEFNSRGENPFSDSRIRVTFDSVRGKTPDKFNLSGQTKGINLQIAGTRGNIPRAGKVVPAIPLTGNEETLDYTLRIMRDGEKLEARDYFAVLGFRVDYERVTPVRYPVIYLFCESGDAWSERQNTFCSQQYYLCDIVVSVL